MHSQACFFARTHYETFTPTYLLCDVCLKSLCPIMLIYTASLQQTLLLWDAGIATSEFIFEPEIFLGEFCHDVLPPLSKWMAHEMILLLVKITTINHIFDWYIGWAFIGVLGWAIGPVDWTVTWCQYKAVDIFDR